MPTTITLKNIPDEIYSRLKAVADSHHRSLNGEAIACFEKVLLPTRLSASERIARAAEIRKELVGISFSAEEIANAIDEGRS